MKQALFENRVIDANEGVDLKTQHGTNPDFKCTECNQAVRVHRAGGKHPAHFEHLERNRHCSLVHWPS